MVVAVPMKRREAFGVIEDCKGGIWTDLGARREELVTFLGGRRRGDGFGVLAERGRMCLEVTDSIFLMGWYWTSIGDMDAPCICQMAIGVEKAKENIE